MALMQPNTASHPVICLSFPLHFWTPYALLPNSSCIPHPGSDVSIIQTLHPQFTQVEKKAQSAQFCACCRLPQIVICMLHH